MIDNPRIAFVAARTDEAQEALKVLTTRYGDATVDEANVIVALGGDGFMLRSMHRTLSRQLPVYGMKLGTVGFLMNQHRVEDLPERINASHATELYPLLMEVNTEGGTSSTALAFNEVSLLRQTKQAAHIRIELDGDTKLDELMCDGVLLSTPAGSTAYNLSANGPILPLGSNVLALTPISPFRPRRWRGAVLPATTEVRFVVLDPYKRPVSATADSHEVRDILDVRIRESREQSVRLLFDPEHDLADRILNEQFES